MEFLKAKLKEKSNWIVILTMAAGWFGYEFNPEFAEEIAGVCVAVVGAVAVFLNEHETNKILKKK